MLSDGQRETVQLQGPSRPRKIRNLVMAQMLYICHMHIAYSQKAGLQDGLGSPGICASPAADGTARFTAGTSTRRGAWALAWRWAWR